MQMPVLAMGWLQSQFGSAPCVPTQPNRRSMVPWAVMIMVPSWGVEAAASRTTASKRWNVSTPDCPAGMRLRMRPVIQARVVSM